MFRAKLKEAIIFKNFIEGIKEIFNGITFDISPKGISFKEMDKFNITLVSLNLSSESFEEYQCINPIKLSISISLLAIALHCGKNEDSLTLSCEDEPSKLNVLFENKSKFKIYKELILLQRIKIKSRIQYIFIKFNTKYNKYSGC